MWLFDKHSFTSTVAYDPSKDVGKSGHKEIALASEDPKGMWLLVRARVEADLTAVEKDLQAIKGDDKFSIHVTTESSADYSYRALISREDMKLYLASIVDGIDYGSHFKEVVKANASMPTERYSAMMGVWSEMMRLQPYVPYGGWGTTGSYYSTLSTAVPFKPSTKWLRVEDAKRMLTEAAPNGWADDSIEALDDDGFRLWLAAAKYVAISGDPDTPLTSKEVDDLIDEIYDELALDK